MWTQTWRKLKYQKFVDVDSAMYLKFLKIRLPFLTAPLKIDLFANRKVLPEILGFVLRFLRTVRGFSNNIKSFFSVLKSLKRLSNWLNNKSIITICFLKLHFVPCSSNRIWQEGLEIANYHYYANSISCNIDLWI